jgi:hypothetical protein
MSTPVLPGSPVSNPPGVVPVDPANPTTPVTGPSRVREKGSSRQRRKKKKRRAPEPGEENPSPEDPKGKKINIRA